MLNSAVMLVAPGRGYNSYFEMPFHKRARITMENRGDKDENLYYIITGAYQEIPSEAGYFHATYRQEHPVQKVVPTQSLTESKAGDNLSV